jgi:hypothetical protein
MLGKIQHVELSMPTKCRRCLGWCDLSRFDHDDHPHGAFLYHILYNMNTQVPVVCWNKVAPHRGCVVPQGMELVAQPGTWRTWDITALLESILTVRSAFRLPVNWEVVVAATIGGPDQRPVSPCCAAGPLFAGPPPSETVCTLRYCSSNSRCISKSAWRSRFNRCCS